MTFWHEKIGGQRLALVLIAAAALSISACGKRGSPQPPEGEESQYIFPQFYPNPEETLEVRRDAGFTLATDDEVEAREEEVEDTIGSEYRLGPDGYNRTRTKVYGWE